jgi:hypothetical protein
MISNLISVKLVFPTDEIPEGREGDVGAKVELVAKAVVEVKELIEVERGPVEARKMLQGRTVDLRKKVKQLLLNVASSDSDRVFHNNDF